MELGKVLAQRIVPELQGREDPKLGHDTSTNNLIRRYRMLKGGVGWASGPHVRPFRSTLGLLGVCWCTRRLLIFAVRTPPRYRANVFSHRGHAEQAKGDLDHAIADFTKAVQLRPDSDSYTNRGDAEQAKGDLDGAVADYTKAIQLQPSGASSFNHRGFAKQVRGDLDGANADFAKTTAVVQGAAPISRSFEGCPSPSNVVPTQSKGAYYVGAGISAPRLLSKVDPTYTPEALAAHCVGAVKVYMEVGVDGLAGNIQVVQGLGLGLDERAVEAVKRWKFEPGMKDDVPVVISATIDIHFDLQKN